VIHRRVVRWKPTTVSEEHVASIFKISEKEKSYILATFFMLVSCLAYPSTLKMEAIRYSETSADFQHNRRLTSQDKELLIHKFVGPLVSGELDSVAFEIHKVF
jgi:hypothetical protein